MVITRVIDNFNRIPMYITTYEQCQRVNSVC